MKVKKSSKFLVKKYTQCDPLIVLGSFNKLVKKSVAVIKMFYTLSTKLRGPYLPHLEK